MKPTKLARRVCALVSGLLLAASLSACGSTGETTTAASQQTSGATITTGIPRMPMSLSAAIRRMAMTSCSRA